ncbi:hypothetical protein [Caldisphaera sp.]|uniref:hypothetical protein n=1 Tax=Caldisphaera sp. TaxID=2060322 RepID=UPI0025B88CA4|nr:hypothetical protein [Caldisphaera sp.]
MIIIYHDPGNENEAEKFLKLMKENNIEATIIPISKINELIPKANEIIISLIPFRGGHNESIKEIADRYNAKYIKIPLEMIYVNLKKYLSDKKCKDVCFLYWNAKRFVELQEEDLDKIRQAIKNELGIESYSNCEECHDCFIALTLMKGKISEKALSYYKNCKSNFVLEDILSVIEEDLVKWIKSIRDAGGGV